MPSAFATVSRHLKNITALLLALMLTACGGGSTGAPQSSAPQSSAPGQTTPSTAQSFGYQSGATRQGSVQFPTGVTVTLDSLTAVNGFGTAPVSASGTFTLDTVSTDAQYAAINSQAGVPLLCGWLGDTEPVINAHTTAEVYIYFAAYIYTVPDAASRTAIVASISQLPGLSTVEQAISASLAADPTANPASNPAVASAISTLLAGLLTSNAPAAAGIKFMKNLVAKASAVNRSLLFQPGTGASGITIVDNGQNSIQFQNTLRRGAAAYVDEISHVDSSGNTVKDQLPDTNAPVTIPAVTALGTFGGTIANILNGNYALVPNLTALQEVPNVANAQSTTYRIAIVGPGANLGDYNSLTEPEQEMSRELFIKQMIFEITLPLIASTLVPVGSWGEEIFENEVIQTLVQDTIAALAATNAVTEAAESGDPKGVYDAVIATLAGNVTLTEPLLKAAIAAVNLVAQNVSTSSISVEAEALVIPLKLADGIIAITDYLFIFQDDNAADKGDIFNVIATDPSVTLTPASSSVGINAIVSLTAALHPPQNTSVVYQYTNTALYGHLTPTTGGAGTDNFTTTNPTVTYTANGTGGGTDTITVTPQYLVAGLPNENIGTVSATVAVNPPTPQPPSSGILPFTMNIVVLGPYQGINSAGAAFTYSTVFGFFEFQTYSIPVGTYLISNSGTSANTTNPVNGAVTQANLGLVPLIGGSTPAGGLPPSYAGFSSFGGGIIGYGAVQVVAEGNTSVGDATAQALAWMQAANVTVLLGNTGN